MDYHSKFEAGGIYHIYNRGNNREKIFREPENYRFFREKWKKYIHPYSSLLAYCQMSNHFHFLIKVDEDSDHDINEILEQQFQRLFISYSLAFNKRFSRTGSLFQKRFKRIRVDTDAYISSIIKYIHLNPILHGFTSTLEEWPYTSYLDILERKETFIDPEYTLSWFGGLHEFKKNHLIELKVDWKIKRFLVEED